MTSTRLSIAALGLLAGLPGLDAAPPASAASYYLSVDVPADLAGVELGPGQILRSDDGVYSVEATLGLPIRSIHRRSDGIWLMTPETPAEIGGLFRQANDVLAYDGSAFSVVFDGSATGVPDGAAIDAVLLDSAGHLVLSFDVPVALGGTEYGPSDLVRWEGGTIFSSYWDAEGAGVPSYANLVGADRDGGGTLVVSFDVPTNLGAEFMPGQLIRWTPSGFASYFADPAWPASARLRDFSLVPPAGSVPGGSLPGLPFSVARDPLSGAITLSWDASCASGDVDYEIYKGTAGHYYSHMRLFCSTGGATTITFADPPDSAYFLVVPRSAFGVEGSYGLASDGSERPPAIDACLPQQAEGACP